MVFSVDTTSVTPGSLLCYSISAKATEWLLGGKISGVLPVSGQTMSVEVVGIPATPGLLTGFPRMEVSAISEETGDVEPLDTKFQHPPAFRSRAKLTETSVAFPTNTKMAV